MKILIPARMGSKGLPGKNRILFEFTAKIIPYELANHTYVSSDDPVVIDLASKKNFNTIHRDPDLAKDETSTKLVVEDFLNKTKNISDDLTVLLYLTYPERKWEDVIRANNELVENNARSLLCSFPLEVHPFMMAYDLKNGKGKQICPHNMYRRQDYPACFEISHYISMFYDDEVKKLNNNLYNDDTHFMKCDKKIDVDLAEHLQKLK
mgnify:CR=1 FL=1